MTARAMRALEVSQVIAGYGVIWFVRPRSPTRCTETPMRQEAERCRMAIDAALSGQTVAMISSGDAGVYGMAGLVYEMAEGNRGLDIEVVPGVTAALSGAAVLRRPWDMILR